MFSRLDKEESIRFQRLFLKLKFDLNNEDD